MDTPFYIDKPCEHGHVFVWSSDSTVDIHPPKGTTCQCGASVADGKDGILGAATKQKEIL